MQGFRGAEHSSKGHKQLQGEMDEAEHAARNVAPPPAHRDRGQRLAESCRQGELSGGRQEFTTSSPDTPRVHLPLAFAAPVVVTLGNCSCIDLEKQIHQGIWLIFRCFVLYQVQNYCCAT